MSAHRPHSELADSARPWYGRAQAVTVPLTPAAYQALTWFTLDLHLGKTGDHPTQRLALDTLQTYMGKPSTGTVQGAVNELEEAGLLSITRGRGGVRNTYRYADFVTDPRVSGPVPCIGPAPLVRRVAALPSVLTPTTGLRTLLQVCAVAQGTHETFAVSRADLFEAAHLGHSQGTVLFAALKNPDGHRVFQGVPPLLRDCLPRVELVRSGAGARPSEHRLTLPVFDLPELGTEAGTDD